MVIITNSGRKGKRLKAIFEDGTIIHFGQEGGQTYIDHKDEKKKRDYIARHFINEDWTNPKTAGALSRFILWNKKTMEESVKDFKRRFGFK